MTATTILKRIGSKRKDITRYEKEISRYWKDYQETDSEYLKCDRLKWIDYYEKLIAKTEDAISEMSKQAAEIATADEQRAMIRAMAEEMAQKGFKRSGLTTKGLHYRIEGNCGITERSRNCYTMYIEGRGAVFTSGTLETVAGYILQN